MFKQLFVKNPFGQLKVHTEVAGECARSVRGLFDALYAGDHASVKAKAVALSQLEHRCDDIKRDIRTNLTRSVFLPVDRRDVLSMLHFVDNIADSAEDIGVILTMRPLVLPDALKPAFDLLLARALAVVDEAIQVVSQLDLLLESGFSGPDAEAVLAMVDNVGRLEHEADKAQDQFGRLLFEHEDDFKPAALFLWIKVAGKVGDLANAAENAVSPLRLMLSL